MRPGWVRRGGSDLIAIGLGVPILLMGFAGTHSDIFRSLTIENAVRWSFYISPIFEVGLVLWIFGGPKRKS